MTESIKTRVRAEQARQFAESHTDPEVVKATNDLYDAVEALTGPQRRLLINNTLHAAQSAVRQTTQPVVGGSFAFLANGLLAIAGYALELEREAAGDTATGDRAVDDALDGFTRLTELYATSNMTPESIQRAEEAAQRVSARVAAGEDHQQAIQAELAALSGQAVEASASPAGEDHFYGQYL